MLLRAFFVCFVLTDLFGGNEKMSTFAIPNEKRDAYRGREFFKRLALEKSLKIFAKRFGD